MAKEGTGGERTEPATPKKRQEAREKGNVAKSQDLVVAASLLAMFAALKALGPTIVNQVGAMAKSYLGGTNLHLGVVTSSDFSEIMATMVFNFISIMIPVLALALAVAVAFNVIQVGFLFSTKALAVNFGRMNPLEGIKRMFSVTVLVELLKNSGKVAVIGIIIYNEIVTNMNMFPLMMTSGLEISIVKIVDLIINAALKVMVFLMIIAVIDVFYQRKKYEKELRMSKQEVKMEYKSQEGDPMVKGRIKQKQREMSMMRMMQSVPDADVIITNPTHYAIALKYDEKEGAAPKVTAKGKDLVAQRIKEKAKEHNIKIVEDKPLARSLYLSCEIGDFIPVEMYQAVAEILAEIFRMRRK